MAAKHLVLSGCFILNEKKEILLLYKRNHQHYETPGGKVEAEECKDFDNPTLAELVRAAEREAYEELGDGIRITSAEYFGKVEFTIPDGRLAVAHKVVMRMEGVPRVNEPDKFSKYEYLQVERLQDYPLSPDLQLLLPELVGFVKKNI